jgi:ADP-ribose pyrophosphatase
MKHRGTRRSQRWKVIERQQLFSGGPVREVSLELVSLPHQNHIVNYYQVRMDDFALVFATTDAGVLLLRQYKHGVRDVCLTFPGGAVREGETPLEAAKRELLEETGFAADSWIDYGAYVTNANQHCNRAHLFRAECCRRISAPQAPDMEAGELLIMPVDDLQHPDMPLRFGLTSHVALLAMATHPRLHACRGRRTVTRTRRRGPGPVR